MGWRYYQTFDVTGQGHFPLDMLRYDHCWPRYEAQICDIPAAKEKRTIAIARRVDGPRVMPTIERWRSFGWTVTNIQTDKR